jgi:pyrophosphatase PpaX
MGSITGTGMERSKKNTARHVTMKYLAVLFDFDGTLSPSLPLWINAFQLAFSHYGITVSDDEIIRRCFYRNWDEIASDFGIPPERTFVTEIEKGLRQGFLEAELFPLAASVIAHCRDHGLATALVTSSPRYLLAGALPRLGLASLFDAFVFGDDVQNIKPHPEPLLSALAILGCLPSEAIMVGDSPADMLAGKAAGTATALFLPDETSPYARPEALRATEPDIIFSHHGDLPAMLGLPVLKPLSNMKEPERRS